MVSLQVTELADILSLLPSVEPLDQVVSNRIDLFVCASGFEPRVSAVADFLATGEYTVAKACYLTYRDNESENLQARGALLQALGRLTEDVFPIDGDEPDRGFWQSFNDVIDDLINSYHREGYSEPLVVFDVSSASTRLILSVLHVLYARNIRVTVAYSQALTYFPTAQEFEIAEEDEVNGQEDGTPFSGDSLGLDYDVREIDFSVEYPGRHFDNLPDRVFVVAGFNGLRSKAALAFVDPALVIDHPNPRVTWIAGEPLEEADKWRIIAMLRVNGLLDQGARPADVRIVSTSDYRETLRVLGEAYASHFITERITVAPMGSKMQTVGVSIFCELYSDVRVVLTRPASHEGKHYSDGVRKIWGIDFGSVPDFRSLLSSLGEARLVE